MKFNVGSLKKPISDLRSTITEGLKVYLEENKGEKSKGGIGEIMHVAGLLVNVKKGLHFFLKEYDISDVGSCWDFENYEELIREYTGNGRHLLEAIYRISDIRAAIMDDDIITCNFDSPQAESLFRICDKLLEAKLILESLTGCHM